MITIRRSLDRGQTKIDWLDSRHTFSFGEYFDSEFISFHTLRVINEDYVKPAFGFPTHPHRDMEIITYVLSGALEHQDSMGNGSIIKPGDVQRMSAGTGVRHSEANPSATETVHLLQIWIMPEKNRLTPSYEQRSYTDEQMQNKFCLIASHDARENSVKIHQAVDLYTTKLDAGKTLQHQFKNHHYGWVQVARGKIILNNLELQAGDGAAISGEDKIEISAQEKSEVLLFDLG